MDILREIWAILFHHGVRSGVLVVGGMTIGVVVSLLLLWFLYRVWYRRYRIDSSKSIAFVLGLSWVLWLVTLPALLGVAGASAGGAYALRGLFEDPRPLERGVDLAMFGCQKALESAALARPEGLGASEIDLALGFVDGSDKLGIEAVPARLKAFSDEAVVRALGSVDGFLMSDDEPDPLIRWLAAQVVQRMSHWPVAGASELWLEPVLGQLREKDAREHGDGTTTGPDVALAISRHYGQRPLAYGLFWGVMIQVLIVLGLVMTLVALPIFLVWVCSRLSQERSA